MPSPEIILKLETALRAYTIATGHLPAVGAAFGIYCAHKGEVIPTAMTDYLVIHSGRPGGANTGDGINEMLVEFQLFTGALKDEAERPDAVVLHDERSAALDWIWGEENFATALAAISALTTNEGIAFTGWWAPEDAAEDGRTEAGQLVSKLRRTFICHLAE